MERPGTCAASEPLPFYPLPVPSWYTGPVYPFSCCYPHGSFQFGRCPWLPAYDPRVEAIRHLRRGQELLQRYQLADALTALEDSLRQQSDFAEAHFWLAHVLQERDDPGRAIESYRRALRFGFRDPAVARNNLGTALSETGRWAEAVEQYRAAVKLQSHFEQARANLKEAEARAALSRKLDAVLAGKEKPASADERAALAETAHVRKQYEAAARLWLEVPPRDGAERYHAAGSAVRASAGGESERWRKRALDWMREELAALEKQVGAKKVEQVRQTLRHWRRNPDFDAVRLAPSLAQLPREERTAWASFWADAGYLLRRADALPSGQWKIEGQELVQAEVSDPPEAAVLYFGEANWSDVAVEVEVKGRGEFGLCLRAADPGTQVIAVLGGWGNSLHGVLAQKGGAVPLLLGQTSKAIPVTENWHRVRASARGNGFRVTLDERELFGFQVEGFPRGKVGLRTFGSPARFRNLRISEGPRTLLEGLPPLPQH